MYKKRTLIFLLLSLPLIMQFNPQPKELTAKFFPEKNDLPEVTPGLKKKKKFTNYQELISYLDGLAKKFPDKVQLSYIGKSKKGKDIPMIRIRTNTPGTKIRVWMQGGLHGDEPASTESLLYLLYTLLFQENNTSILENIDLAIVPMANIDGYLKQRRNNAEDLDLNRDQTKLMAAESPLLKQAFTRFSPHVSLDFHEYRPYRRDYVKMGTFGVTSLYDVMLLYSGNLNVPEAQRHFTQQRFLDPTRKVLDEAGFRHHDYITPFEEEGHIHFNCGSNNARSSATNFALLNSISTLVEVRGVGLGRTSFKRRTYTGYLIAKSFLEISVKEKEAILQLLQNPASSSESVITSSRKQYEMNIDFIDIDKAEIIPVKTVIQDAWYSKAKLVRTRPFAYVIEKGQEQLIRKLKTFELLIDTLKNPQELEIEQFYVEKYSNPAEKYEKMKLQEVETRVEITQKTFPAGTYIIRTRQNHGNILSEVLEPEAPNSFVSFGVLPTRSGQYLPIYRQINP